MVRIKNINLAMKKNDFDGTVPIHIFDFLARFDTEADMLNISETQIFIALPTLL